MKAVNVPVGARGLDSEPWSRRVSPASAQAVRASGVEFAMLYLGTMTAGSLANLLAAGLGYVPVTYADAFNGLETVSQLHALGVPQGVTVLLDVEGPGIMADPAGLITKINAWGDVVQAAGYIAGVYIGSPQPLTSAELSALRVFRYMRGQGSNPRSERRARRASVGLVRDAGVAVTDVGRCVGRRGLRVGGLSFPNTRHVRRMITELIFRLRGRRPSLAHLHRRCGCPMNDQRFRAEEAQERAALCTHHEGAMGDARTAC